MAYPLYFFLTLKIGLSSSPPYWHKAYFHSAHFMFYDETLTEQFFLLHQQQIYVAQYFDYPNKLHFK